MSKSALEQIKELEAQYGQKVAQLKAAAIAELNAKLKEAKAEVASIESQIAEFTGIASPATPKREASGRLVSITRLLEIFKEQDTKELNIRKERLNTACIRKLAQENPTIIHIGGKNPWPTVKVVR